MDIINNYKGFPFYITLVSNLGAALYIVGLEFVDISKTRKLYCLAFV